MNDAQRALRERIEDVVEPIIRRAETKYIEEGTVAFNVADAVLALLAESEPVKPQQVRILARRVRGMGKTHRPSDEFREEVASTLERYARAYEGLKHEVLMVADERASLRIENERLARELEAAQAPVTAPEVTDETREAKALGRSAVWEWRLGDEDGW